MPKQAARDPEPLVILFDDERDLGRALAIGVVVRAGGCWERVSEAEAAPLSASTRVNCGIRQQRFDADNCWQNGVLSSLTSAPLRLPTVLTLGCYGLPRKPHRNRARQFQRGSRRAPKRICSHVCQARGAP